jgi:hypothetical protein
VPILFLNLDNGGMVLYHDGLPWLGFDLQIDRVGNCGTFRLAVQPIDGVPFFRQTPALRDIRDDDRVLLDVLEQSAGGKKVFDTFQVGLKGTPMQIMPMPLSVPDVPDSGTVLRVDHPRLVKGVETSPRACRHSADRRLPWGMVCAGYEARSRRRREADLVRALRRLNTKWD